MPFYTNASQWHMAKIEKCISILAFITEFHMTRSYIGEGKGTPLQYFAWKIPWMEELGGLQSMGSLRVGHD